MNFLSGVALWEGITLVDMAYYSLRVAIWIAILSAELPFVTAVKRKLNSLLEKEDNAYPLFACWLRLLITFANSLDPDQDRQNVGP